MVENDERYEAAKRSALQLLKKGVHLGEKITWLKAASILMIVCGASILGSTAR